MCCYCRVWTAQSFDDTKQPKPLYLTEVSHDADAVWSIRSFSGIIKHRRRIKISISRSGTIKLTNSGCQNKPLGSDCILQRHYLNLTRDTAGQATFSDGVGGHVLRGEEIDVCQPKTNMKHLRWFDCRIGYATWKTDASYIRLSCAVFVYLF